MSVRKKVLILLSVLAVAVTLFAGAVRVGSTTYNSAWADMIFASNGTHQAQSTHKCDADYYGVGSGIALREFDFLLQQNNTNLLHSYATYATPIYSPDTSQTLTASGVTYVSGDVFHAWTSCRFDQWDGTQWLWYVQHSTSEDLTIP